MDGSETIQITPWPDAAATQPAGARSGRRRRWLRGVGPIREAGVYLATLGLAALIDAFIGQRIQAAVIVVLGAAALAGRRRWPLLAAAVPVVVMTWSQGAGVVLLVLCYGAGYRVTSRAHLHAWLAGYAATTAAIVGVSWSLGAHELGSLIVAQFAGLLLAAALPGFAGQYRAQRHALLAALRDRAEQAERERTIVAEQARLRERTRIAQDMHDTIGHQLALISLQAASLEVDATLGAEQQETSRLLGATARAAMDELRTVVGALHTPDGAAETLAGHGIDELIRSARGAGLGITLVRDGEEQPLPVMTQHALYRVVQESLTNAHKHAPGTPVTVSLRYEPDTLVVEIRNLRAAAGSTGGGQGIIGLRERVRVIGGLLRAGADGADYRVVAILPYLSGAAEPAQTAAGGQPALSAPSPPPAAPAGDAKATGSGAARPAGGGGLAQRAVAAGVGLLFAGGVVVSVHTTSSYLSRSVFDGLRVGQSRQAVTSQLPRQLLAPSVEVGTPPPEAASCMVYFVSPADADESLNARLRLCFRGGVLIEKREIPP